MGVLTQDIAGGGPHKASHENAGSDEVSIEGLSGSAADAQKVAFAKAGTLVSTRPQLNFIEGQGVTLAVNDNPGLNRADITISSDGEGGGGETSDSSNASNMYWAKPTTPDSFDDEFDSGSADLATRGWLVVDTAGAPMTRAGEIDPWSNPSAIPANQYRSTLTASGLLIQCSTQMNVLKPVSGSFQLRSYAHPASFPSGGTNYIGPTIASNTLLTPAGTKYAYILHYGNNEEAARHDSGHLVLQTRSLATAGEPGALNQLLDWNDTAKELRWLSTRPWGWTNFYGSYTWTGFSATYAGLTIHTSQATPHTFAVVRYLRRAPQNSYPVGQGSSSRSSGTVASDTNRFWVKPAVPDPFDDEFELGSDPDLAARGWTVRSGTDGTVQTRVGDVIWTGNPGLSANQYRSTITPDGLCMQTSMDTWVYKPASGSFQLRGSMQMSAPTGSGFYCGLQAWNEALPVLNDTLSRLYLSPQGGNLIAEQMVPNNSYTTLASVSAGVPETLPASEFFLDLTPAVQRYWAFTTNGFARLETSGAINPFNPAVAGFNVATHGGTTALRWSTIRYVRKAAQGSFPVNGISGAAAVVAAPHGAYLRRVTPANPLDDEFDSGSPDLAARGWTFRRWTATAGTMVRVGDIDPRRADGLTPALGPLEYRSSLIDGRLYLQLPLGSAIHLLTKAHAPPTGSDHHGSIVWSRFKAANFDIASGEAAGIYLGFFTNVSGFADIASAIDVGERCIPGSVQHRSVALVSGSGVTVDITRTLGAASAGATDDIKVLRARATSPNLSWAAEYADSVSGAYNTVFDGSSTHGAITVLQHVGFLINPVDATSPRTLPFDVMIDFFRIDSGDLAGKWIGNL